MYLRVFHWRVATTAIPISWLPVIDGCYQYAAINPEEIRCLELHAGVKSDPINARILIYNRGNLPSFESISYRWHITANKEPVHVEGSQLRVDTTVAGMLRQLRSKDSSRLIWVDAICINQEDEDEKTEQVRRMGQIYTQSSGTRIWFGDADEHTASAFDLISTLWQAVTRSRSTENILPTNERLIECGLPNGHDHLWPAFQNLLHRPWFQRTWTLQEVHMSQYRLIQCGQYQYDWSRFAIILVTLSHSRAPGLDITHAARVADMDSTVIEDDNRMANLLRMTVGAGTSDPRDKVFALVSLAAEKDSLRSVIDYDKPTAQVFTDIAEFYLTRGTVDILNSAGGPSWPMSPKLPSWAPVWSTESQVQPLMAIGSDPILPNIEKSPRASISHGVLHVPGAIIDEVVAVGRPFPFWSKRAPPHWPYSHLAQWRQMAHKHSPRHFAGARVDIDFMRTLLADTLEPSIVAGVAEEVSERFESLIVSA